MSFSDLFKPYEVFEALAQHHLERAESNESLIEIFGDYYSSSAQYLDRQKDPSKIESAKDVIRKMEVMLQKLSNPSCARSF